MLLERRARDGILDGSITLLFRRWQRPQVASGRRYRTAAGIVFVEAIDVVDPGAITLDEARKAGYASVADAVADLRGMKDQPVYRVQVRRLDEADPRDALARQSTLTNDDRAELRCRLDRLDRASTHGPWTAALLAAIADRPGTRAADLAADFGRELMAFKADVRRLKNLGLTISLEIGYRLSPRGQAFLYHDGSST